MTLILQTTILLFGSKGLLLPPLILPSSKNMPAIIEEFYDLVKIEDKDGIKDIVEAIDGLTEISKLKALLEILLKNPDEKRN